MSYQSELTCVVRASNAPTQHTIFTIGQVGIALIDLAYLLPPKPPLTPIFSLSMRWTISFLLLLVYTVPAFSQQSSLRGFVSDEVTEGPLQLASVVLEGENDFLAGAVTDGDGYFIIRRVPDGRYTLRVSFIGFNTHEETLDLPLPENTNKIIILSPSQQSLEEVVVEAEEETGISTVVAGLETMVPAQVQRVPMLGVTGDLASYLQTIPGVAVQGDRGGQFFVRGGAVDQNLVMLDGMPVYMPFHVLSFYSAFPEETMDNAAFYTGGFGAKYGTRASSILDVTTRNGNKQNLAGSFSVAPFLSTARIEGPLIKDRVSVIASGRHSLIEDIFPSILGQELPYQFGDLFGKVHAFISPNHSLSVTGLHTYDRGDIAGTFKTFDGEALSTPPIDSSEVAWENTVYGGTYTFLPEGIPLIAEISANRSDMLIEMGPRDARERSSGIESMDLGLDITYFHSDLIDFRLGALRRNSTLDYELGGQFQGIPALASNDLLEYTGYLETSIKLQNGLLVVEPGVHLYMLPDRSEQKIDPRARISWMPPIFKSKVRINAAAGRYHQAIAGLNDERDVGNLFTAWTIIPDDSPLTSSIHTIVGLNIELSQWVSIAAEGFQKTYDNLSVPVFNGSPSFTTALQPADGEARGIDLRLEFQNRPFISESLINGYISYSLSEVTYTTGNVSYNPAHDRRQQINAIIEAEKDELSFILQWQVGTGFPFTQSSGFDIAIPVTPDVDVTATPGDPRVAYGAPFEGRQPDYERMDAWIERRIERGRTVVTLRAGAINIFNRENLFYFDLFELRRVDQLPFTPSVGLKVELR